MEFTRYRILYTTRWLLQCATFLDPQTRVWFMGISNYSQNQWVEKPYFVQIVIKQYLLNRVLRCKRIGLIDTEQQFNSNGHSELSWSLLTNSKQLNNPFHSQRKLVLWPRILRQTVTYCPIIMIIGNIHSLPTCFVGSLEMVRCPVI